jgi:hypothetical protein
MAVGLTKSAEMCRMRFLNEPPQDHSEPRHPNDQDLLNERIRRVEEVAAFADHEGRATHRAIVELGLVLDRLGRRIAAVEERLSELGQHDESADPIQRPSADEVAPDDEIRD